MVQSILQSTVLSTIIAIYFRWTNCAAHTINRATMCAWVHTHHAHSHYPKIVVYKSPNALGTVVGGTKIHTISLKALYIIHEQNDAAHLLYQSTLNNHSLYYSILNTIATSPSSEYIHVHLFPTQDLVEEQQSTNVLSREQHTPAKKFFTTNSHNHALLQSDANIT